MSVIANTTVISNFACIRRLELLRQLYGELYISTEVYEEIRAGLEEGYQFYDGFEQLVHPFNAHGWIRLTGLIHEEELRPSGSLPPLAPVGQLAPTLIR